MSAQFARAPHQGRAGQLSDPPHAALLIDFDNVTMGIRSDLTKELKNLLNSDIIKGKVAVQRAYADWRRYPQYIVPLAESSVDLIFAPAYGSAKKNATDIRLAIDALELVFVRPEIGTFILLSGDSDFSSLVLKLKEYGKYVIGVGIRESASDLLVQNCDEYYSYSALTGLTRAGEEAPAASEDPWELVDVAIHQMADNGDVMRSDRLKQVLLELDPNFDEKALGFTKFNKFLQEASTRGVLSLRKQENGQFEIAPADGTPPKVEEEEQRSRRRRGGRGRRGGREEREQLTTSAAPAPAVEPAPQPQEPEAAKPAAQPVEAAAKKEETPEPRKQEKEAPAAAKPAGAAPAAEKKSEPGKQDAPVEPVGNDLDAAFALLRRATQDAQRSSGGGVARDSDVKRRLLELDPAWDESNLGFSKFSRFLRRAHDEEVVTLNRLDNGNYEVAAGSVDVVEEPRGRGRGRGRSSGRGAASAAPAREERPAAKADAPAAAGTEKPPAAAASQSTPGDKAQPAAAAASKPAPSAQSSMFDESAGAPAARPAQTIGLRRGSRSRGGVPSGPPPLFEGQTLNVAGGKQPAAQQPAKAAEAQKPAAAQETGGTPSWFPTGRSAVIGHLSSYQGVGKKTAEQVADAFGADGVYAGLAGEPDRVRELLGPRRGGSLLKAFEAERAERAAGASPEDTKKPASRPAAESGRGRGGAKKAARKTAAKSAAGGTKPAARKQPAKRAAAKKTARKTARKSGGKTTPAK